MEIFRKARKLEQIFREQRLQGLKAKLADRFYVRREKQKYAEFVRRNQITESYRDGIREKIKSLANQPFISVLLPVYNTDEKWLRLCIESVRDQLYTNWELCIADDYSSKPHVRQVLEEYVAADERIKVVFREENGHISAASNSALEIATGEFVALLDHDDELSEEALFWVANEINDHPETELIYSDEDLIDTKDRRSRPRFKPDWSPDLFLSLNLINHLAAFRTETVRKVGGFRMGFEGSQDHDLELRFIEQILEESIKHIPRILYHWRVVQGSVALAGGEKPYAHERARRAIREHLERAGRPADVSEGAYDLHRIRFQLPADPPKVSLIFIEDGETDVFFRRAAEIVRRTDYSNLEVLIVSHVNGPRSSTQKNISYVSMESQSTSETFNLAATKAEGSILCFADTNLLQLSPDWLKEMVGWAIQEKIGAVGAKLLYRNWTVMHGGLITGVEGTVGIAHRGYGREALGNMFRNRFPGNFSATSACFLVIEKKKFEQLDGFDSEKFPEHLFDADLCLRLREAGLRIVVTPYAELIQTTDRIPKILSEPRSETERINFEKKWPEYLHSDPFYNPNLSRAKGDFSIDI